MDFNKISELGNNNGGIKLYRNGFRVLPYGERGNDWINIDKTSLKTQDNAYVPFNNPNFFGFVEVIDKDGKNFEETSSREGLIENSAFQKLTDFVNKALRVATQRINSARLREKQLVPEPQDLPDTNLEEEQETQSKPGQTTTEKLQLLKDGSSEKDAIINEAIKKIEEVEMLRVLAGIGLNIAEFTHEIRQFIPSFNGSINYLLTLELPTEGKESLINLKENFNRFRTYTAYIDHTITENTNRDKIPIDIRKAVRSFHSIILKDLSSGHLLFNEDYYGFDLYIACIYIKLKIILLILKIAFV
ncbi:MAG: hypothetical protein EOO43_21820 [Flavobacterium sp.]|nr:MAG: hypothetical protein EOO43_21820 [Flavobacterium sp.]